MRPWLGSGAKLKGSVTPLKRADASLGTSNHRGREPHLPIPSEIYIIGCMGLYEVELEPEVRRWLEGLDDRDFGRVDFLVGLLAEQPELLGEPYSRHLGGKVRELRFRLLGRQTRVTYWLAGGQPAHRASDCLLQDPQRGNRRSRACPAGTEDVRRRARHGPRSLRARGTPR